MVPIPRPRGGRGMRLAGALVCLGLGAQARIINVVSDKGELLGKSEEARFPLQSAIDAAEPGDTVLLAPGMYYEDIKSSVDGNESAPITIKGPTSAVVRGNGGMSVVSITHHHIHLEGFSIDGSGMGQEGVGSMDPDKYHRSLLHVHGDGRVETEYFNDHQHRSGVMGFNGTDLNISHARCSCIMLSGFVTHAELRDSEISDCGRTSTGCAENDGGGDSGSDSNSVGQGLELGTLTPETLAGLDGEVDETAWNAIIDNSFSNIGGACVVVHRGARLNLLDGNACMESWEEDGAGFALLGDANTFRHNYVTDNSGAGLAVGGVDQENREYGLFNQVYNNQLQGNYGGALHNDFLPQNSGKVCQNEVEEGTLRRLTEECKDALGDDDFVDDDDSDDSGGDDSDDDNDSDDSEGDDFDDDDFDDDDFDDDSWTDDSSTDD